MVKTGAFKKIAALTAAIAMVGSFAVCASAVSVTSTTAYTNDKANVTVTATVSGLAATADAPVQVTYYATNAAATDTDTVVFIDQTTATSASVTFPAFTTKAAYLNSDVKVGYTNGTAESGKIDAYTITCEGATVYVPKTNDGGTVQIRCSMPAGKEFVSATGTGVTDATYMDGILSVTFGGAITGDVTITVERQDEVVYSGSHIDGGAAVTSEGRKLTVLGQVKGATSFGILVSTNAIATGTLDALPEEGVDQYAAKGANNDGYFAVQLIDTAAVANAEFIVPGTAYHTALYYVDKAGKYVISSGETLTVSAQ